MKLIKNIIILTVVSASVLLAAPLGISDVLKEIKLPNEILKKKKKPLINISGINKYSAAMKDDKSGRKVFIKDFIIKNAFNIDKKELYKLLKIYKNRKFTFLEFQNITSIITKEYRNRGYFVARAYIPKQSMKNNILTINVIEGQYGKFRLANNSLIKDSVIQGFLDNTKLTGSVRTASVDKASLERTMLLINDLPGAVISKANVKPGSEVGTSDFDISSSTKAAYAGYLLADNFGGYYTGRDRLMGGLNINSPFNMGDKLSFSALISNGEDLVNGTISYSMPLNYSGLKAKLSYSDTSYYLSKDLKDLKAQGNSKSLNLNLSYPVYRSRLENLYTYINLASNKLQDETKSINDISEKTSDIISIGLDYDKSDVWFDIENQTKLSFSLSHGSLDFKDKDKKNDDKKGANTQGSFSKINLEISEDMYFTNNFYLESSFSFQYALGNKNLDGSEDFSVGGAYGVKLYPSGEINAENGYLFNIEAKYALEKIAGVSSVIGLFYDVGSTYMANNSVDYQRRTLHDIGLAYYVNYKDFFLNIQAACAINNEEITSEKDSNSRVLILTGMNF